MIDLGDLTWNKEQELVCPNNLLGTIDVYVTTHHGRAQSNAPGDRARAAAAGRDHEQRAVERRIGRSDADRVKSSPGLNDFWQLHYSLDASDANMPAAMIANLDESTAHYLKVSAQRDGSFTVTNSYANPRYAARRRPLVAPTCSRSGRGAVLVRR